MVTGTPLRTFSWRNDIEQRGGESRRAFLKQSSLLAGLTLLPTALPITCDKLL